MSAAHRWLAFFSLVVSLWLLPATAHAWIETRILGDDVRIEVDRAGMATVEHAITMRVRGGPLRSFDLAAPDRDAVPLEDSEVSSTKADKANLPTPLLLSFRPDGALRVSVDHPRGLRAGTYLFRVRYRTNLLATGALERDGAMLRISWSGPIWSEGIGSARTTFVLPPAPAAPRSAPLESANPALEDADEGALGTFLEEVRRHPDRDEIELLRPHIARREQAIWSIRFDPRALGALEDARLQPPPPAPAELTPFSRSLRWGPLAGALLVAFSLLVAVKSQQVAKLAGPLALLPRPLLPAPPLLRALLAGPCFAFGLVLQAVLDAPIFGTVFVLLATALTTYLTPRWKPRPRGPGRWLPITDADAFAAEAPPKGLSLDLGTPSGRRLFALGLALFAVAAGSAYVFASPYYGYLLAFDAAVLVPIFGTGRRAELPPDLAKAPSPRLRRVAARLRKRDWLRVVAWARLPQGGDRFDELRLLVLPRLPRRGLTAIEVGIAWMGAGGGALALPQVLVRVVEGSPCQEALTEALGPLRWVRGRKPDERVTILSPRLPTAALTASLALRVAEIANDPDRASKRRPARPETLAPSEPRTA